MVSVVIPALNEELAIAQTVQNLHAIFSSNRTDANQNGSYEIIVVNDGSTDSTASIARSQGAKVVTHLYPLGYGRALKRGITEAQYDTIVILDADGTYPVEVIPTFLKEYALGYNMIVGKREGKNYRESWIKMPLRNILKLIVEFTAGQKIPDVNSGLRVFSRSEVMPYFDQLCNTFSFTTSVTLAYLLTGKFVHYIPIPYHPRIGKAKVRLFKDSLRTLQYIVQAILHYNPIKLFLLCCVATTILAGGSFLYAVVFNSIVAGFAGFLSLLSTIVLFAIGLLSDQLRQLLVERTAHEESKAKLTPLRRVLNSVSNG